MSNRKNYNSIVFLTTLSVYLGLVLAGGATPTVLAQAALTRDFDLKKEIVLEDDLDKKPDDEKTDDYAGSLQNYLEEIESFVFHLQKLHKKELFNLDRDSFTIIRQINVACNVEGDPAASTSFTKSVDNPRLDAEVTDAVAIISDNWGRLSDCVKDEKRENFFSTGSKLKVFYDNAQLRIEISAPKLTKQRAEFLAEKFKQEYSLYKPDGLKGRVKTVYENTSFNSENNQVFIVTRLPRAAIDDALAEK